MEYSILIVLLPLLTFFVLGLLGPKMKPCTAGLIGTISLGISTLLSYMTAWQYFTTTKLDGVYQKLIPYNAQWLRITDNLTIDLGILLDPISVMMLVVITTVSLMVHLYSTAYMKGERGYQRYYAFLSLFTFSMLGLVVATNIFQMYIFWELVGVSSYLLIGFYYTKPEAVSAAKKAFIVTRFADLGFLIGILVLSYYTQTFDFGLLTSGDHTLFASMTGSTLMGCSVMTWALVLIFIGGAGKSAMFPLHIWLPDAMEGPTPVSALIHAATMVVAGIYLVARLFPIYYFEGVHVLEIIAYVGAFTALFSATIACVQTDIKRVLAFSTISQIGFMMVAMGVSGYGGASGLGYMASMFHLFTHAMFKALLFLGAGAVIHAVHSNEMEKMGGLRKQMPITHITFLVACLAIAGIPPLSGFFSKDEILAAVFQFNSGLGWVMSFVAGLTAFYMFRLYYRIFWGTPSEHKDTPHEAPKMMTLPLVFFAGVTLVAGFIPFGQLVTSDGAEYIIHIDMKVAITSVIIALAGIAIATLLYRKSSALPDQLAKRLGWVYNAAQHRFYIDECYMFVTKKIIFNGVARSIAWFDRHVIDASVDGMAAVTQWVSRKVVPLQSGQAQCYALMILCGALVITCLVVVLI